MSETIGLIGLGSMGLPLATNLIESGYKLRVYNRTVEKAQSLAEKGAEVVNCPSEVAASGGIVITLLANDQALEAVVLGADGILSRLGSDGIHSVIRTQRCHPGTPNRKRQPNAPSFSQLAARSLNCRCRQRKRRHRLDRACPQHLRGSGT